MPCIHCLLIELASDIAEVSEALRFDESLEPENAADRLAVLTARMLWAARTIEAEALGEDAVEPRPVAVALN